MSRSQSTREKTRIISKRDGWGLLNEFVFEEIVGSRPMEALCLCSLQDRNFAAIGIQDLRYHSRAFQKNKHTGDDLKCETSSK